MPTQPDRETIRRIRGSILKAKMDEAGGGLAHAYRAFTDHAGTEQAIREACGRWLDARERYFTHIEAAA